MKTFKEYAITNEANGKVKGTSISYEVKKDKKIAGPFGDEQTYKVTYKMDGDIAAVVTNGNQGIIDCEVIDEITLGALLNELQTK
jgi:hypothetical protein